MYDFYLIIDEKTLALYVRNRLGCQCFEVSNTPAYCQLRPTLSIAMSHWFTHRAKGREPKSCLCRVFNFKFDCLCYKHNCRIQTSMNASRVENSAQVSSCQLKFVLYSGALYNKLMMLKTFFLLQNLVCYDNTCNDFTYNDFTYNDSTHNT